MTQDATFNTPSLYRKQNGSAGLSSGSTFEIHSGGNILIETGGQLEIPVTTQATTSGTITAFGFTVIGTTIASAYTIAAPDHAGLVKEISCTVHGASSVSQVITFAGSATALNPTGGTTAAVTTLTFTEPGYVRLVSVSTSQWHITNATGSVAIT